MFADVSARAFYDPVLVTVFVKKLLNYRELSRPLPDRDRLKVFTIFVLICFNLFQAVLVGNLSKSKAIMNKIQCEYVELIVCSYILPV